jgi:flagellar basal-body rod protein FlgG
MNYGLYLSATGVLSNLHRQNVLAGNLANVETTGFKPDAVDARQRLPQRLEAGGDLSAPKWMLEQLGGGHFVQPTRVDLAQGPLQPTSNPLDLAIEGDGFFVVDPGRGGEGLHLTRDGRMTLGTGGELVQATTGRRVLDVNGRPIRLNGRGPVDIDSTGAVTQDGAVVANLQLASVDASHLRKVGQSLYRVKDTGVTAKAASGSVRQHHLESSAVDPIMTLNDMIAATKGAEASAKLMQYHDHIMGQVIGTVGRVA